MNHQAELDFIQKLLETYRLSINIFKSDNIADVFLPKDNWIGEFLSKDASIERLFQRFKNLCHPKTIYQIDDGFLCHHIIFILEEDPVNPTYAYVGPYTLDSISKQHLTKLSEKYHFPSEIINKVENYFQDVPYFEEDSHLLSIIYTFCSIIWGGSDQFTTKHYQDFYPINFDSVLSNTTVKEPLDPSHDAIYLEDRYDVERKLMQAVSSGQIPKAELMFTTLSKYQFEARSTNALRNTKNYLIILNTILRVAARNGDVPPFHVDRLSSAYAHKIENITSTNSGGNLMKEMVRKYCLLVKNHSMKGYSLLVRKVLTQIDYDITADLGLKNLATQLNVNPSYLSTLFKKETGSTLTEYVNQKRIEHAVFLLNTSNLQIQMIAQYSGIADVNYFTKTFKKIIGITPKEYRDNISNPF